jgi:ABC-2 type transport system permease protein
MKHLFSIFGGRIWSLAVKEVRQILRNKQLIFLLIFLPAIQIIVYGFALSPDVKYLKLGVVDYAQTETSRELVAAMTENQVFLADTYVWDEAQLGNLVRRGNVTAGVVIPPDFDRQLNQGKTAEIQVLIDGVDANTAGIAQGYMAQIVQNYSRRLVPNAPVNLVQPQVIFLYNPGLISSWFFVPGVMGIVLTLISSLTSSSTVVREKDTGTLEQLLMTPAADWEILTAKIVPLFGLLMGDVLLALGIGELFFHLPFRGSLPAFLLVSGLYIAVGISIGIMLATISKSQQQVVLTSFFVNLPLIQTSGAIAPIESMPKIFQYLSLLNPLRHYVEIIRGFLLKGAGLETLWPHVLALALFATVLLTISIKQFRKQLN